MTALSLIASSSRSTPAFFPRIQTFFRSSLLTQSSTLSSALALPGTRTSPWYLSIPGLASLLELLPPIVLAVPKSKISHSRKSMRSANKGLKNKSNFSNCEACGGMKLAHNICPSCYSQISRKWKSEARSLENGSAPSQEAR